jgi:purine-nucleoside phosphorylase
MLICFQGRIHLYEGYSVEEVVLPVRLAATLGAKILILTNAAGGIGNDLEPGSLMLIEDHIDLQFRRRLRPDNMIDAYMSCEREKLLVTPSPYSEKLREIARLAASNQNIDIKSGILGSLLGPTYETPAEVRMEKKLGVAAVCMSTVAEAVEGARLGMEVLGISCITNRAAGLEGASLNHDEVIEVAARVKDDFIKLLSKIIENI